MKKKLSITLTIIFAVIIYIISLAIAIILIVNPIVEFLNGDIFSGCILLFGWLLALGIISLPFVIYGLKDFDFKQL